MPARDLPASDDAALAAVAERLGRALLDHGAYLTLAESCTGGWLAKVVTDVPGASRWFAAGFVTYSNAAKADVLGVRPSMLDAHGAVSEAVVRAMAAGARKVAGAEAAIAVSGVAGPDGGSRDKPVGTVWFGWSLADREWAECAVFAGEREAVRRQAVRHALAALLQAMAPGVAA